jgi:hypothetical protein
LQQDIEQGIEQGIEQAQEQAISLVRVFCTFRQLSWLI